MTLGDVMDTLREVAVETPPAGLDAGTPVTAIAYDSRRVVPGAVFVALKGLRADGDAFADQAVARGARAIVSESARPERGTVPWVTVRDARLALALLADRFFGHPSRQMPVIGVTGTNGKTTTSYLLASILDAAGLRAGMLGTVAYRIGGEDREASRTTPEAPDVQQLLREMLMQGCHSAVMEVSSHALSLKRVDAMRFAGGVFTNLTRDHLDFHEDMEAYFAAKRRLFELLPADAAGVINLDDPRGASLVEICRRSLTYAINATADVTPSTIDMTLSGLRFQIRTPKGIVHIASRLVGRPNVYNILAATAAALSLDVPVDAVERGIASLAGVPGRFEVVSEPADDVTVVVDYAHTDDALRNLLETARPLSAKRLITVFGCGGDRDRTKRPLMGMVAARLSDVVVITSDNPRSEDPARIIEEIERGIPAGTQASTRAPLVMAVVDRAAAIDRAIGVATAGDVVLIAGKGHEKYQQIGDRVLPFDDGEAARMALAKRRRPGTAQA
ncbi:MAG TPA: UDP-N-acetylmuramoyl-L-alanyl-D-glutamate--2,6-diaminopimelate ligase [Vicinamibacterales bacterium]|nr:UDP-N-acetylmuramoyl-L-alanyl-D-glutamate--2,6-diaminopimelate ligase [Vicinamibacterales bacterium]